MRKKSAGLLMFRRSAGHLEVLLAHPGGPLWAAKDEGAWTIPKGEFDGDEDALSAAKREFEEETGTAAAGRFIQLEPLRQPSGKMIYAWAVEGEFDPATLRSNLFVMEWPPRSGRYTDFPEVDRAEWFTIETAVRKMLSGQRPFLDELQKKLSG